jgi:hypothetical protein
MSPRALAAPTHSRHARGLPNRSERDRATSGPADRILGLQRSAGNAVVGHVLRRAAAGRREAVGDALDHGGRPIDEPARAELERRFGRDFGDVRVHTGERADEAVRAVAAHAFTSGVDIVFGEGEYRPGTVAGRDLLAHELGHVVDQQAGAVGYGAVQRSAIPKEELRRMRDDIDVKLANPKLSKEERARLMKEREDLSQAIGDEALAQEEEPQAPLPRWRKASLGLRPAQPPLPETALPEPASTATRRRPKGTGISRTKSARAAGATEGRKSLVPPPSSEYRDENPRSIWDKIRDERRVGKRLNELAIEGKLGTDVRRVEGRREQQTRTGDYGFVLRDGTEVSADLYNPRSAERTPEDIARGATGKSGQADIVVVELPMADVRKGLELGHAIADTLIANANTSLKRLIVMADGKLVLNRSLAASGKRLLAVQERVRKRMAERTDARDVRAASSGSEPGARSAGRLPAPLGEPVREAMGRQKSRTAAFEGAAQMINAALFDALQGHEVDKISARLAELTPRIQELLAQGYTVTVWGRAEVPDQIDVMGGLMGVRDVGQVVHFVDLWLIPVPGSIIRASAKPRTGRQPQRIYGDPTAPRGGDRVAMRAIERFPRRGYHFVDAVMTVLRP